MSNFPLEFDDEENLYLVHDSLRVTLSEDYNVGDSVIYVENNNIRKTNSQNLLYPTSNFPETGIITLVEQCSDIDLRAISFYYSSKTNYTFNGLTLLSGFIDNFKPKKLTNVVQNVMAEHHNTIKDSIINIETFLGTKDTTDTNPLGDTIEGRINFLRNLVFAPKAWFSANHRVGLVDFEVVFSNDSINLGDNPTITWDFGDQTSSNISLISVTDTVPVDQINVYVVQTNGLKITKTYVKPGIYNVTLTIENEFGTDSVTFEKIINARIEAPEEAVIKFIPKSTQILTEGEPEDGPYETTPIIRSSVNVFIDGYIPSGEMINNPGYYYSGAILDEDSNPIDPIESYTWSMDDDLLHNSSDSFRAAYSIGGIYNLKLRTDTTCGAFRITSYQNAIDIIEKSNLWLYTIDEDDGITANEFGLISETFKTSAFTKTIEKDDSFLNNTNNEDKAKAEFLKNTGFSKLGNTKSGDHGTALLFWSSGGSELSSLTDQTVNYLGHNGFNDTMFNSIDDPYSSYGTEIFRPWNWMFLSSGSSVYFTFGPDPDANQNENKSYQTKSSFTLIPSFSLSESDLISNNYKNGASELINHVSASGYDIDGEPNDGRFAVYRSAWKDSAGYFLRNDNVGNFFRIKSFYKTEGTIDNPFINIKKLTDMPGNSKEEGELVNLSNGLYFFNNSGSIAAYNDVTNTWEIGGPSSNSTSFQSVQDTSILGFDNTENTLLATSDGDKIAYLSYDYSSNAFIKFNTSDLTFSNLGARPSGTQWIMGIY